MSNYDFFMSKENIFGIKEKLRHELYNLLNKENEYIYDQVKAPKYFIGNGNNPMLVKGLLKQRWWWNTTDSIYSANFIWTQWKKRKIIELLPTVKNMQNLFISEFKTKKEPFHKPLFVRICNHLEGNLNLGNKKAIYYNMKMYYESIGKDPFEIMPLTFHIKEGSSDNEFYKFLEAFKVMKSQGENVWIIKPGENSNRGCGICLAKSIGEAIDRVRKT